MRLSGNIRTHGAGHYISKNSTACSRFAPAAFAAKAWMRSLRNIRRGGRLKMRREPGKREGKMKRRNFIATVIGAALAPAQALEGAGQAELHPLAARYIEPIDPDPIGTMQMWAGNEHCTPPPRGWVVANGVANSKKAGGSGLIAPVVATRDDMPDLPTIYILERLW